MVAMVSLSALSLQAAEPVDEETDSKVIGTFSFTCKNVNGDKSVINITDGAFNLKKQTT